MCVIVCFIEDGYSFNKDASLSICVVMEWINCEGCVTMYIGVTEWLIFEGSNGHPGFV